jgi:hypothetical protein
MIEEIQYDFFDLDGALFRRPWGNIGGVTDVFRERTKTWEPYRGDRTKPALFGDRCSGPQAER